ncbi:MAG: hypothetical protein KHY34_10370 [Lachnospiraceae bacterium]|jgi:hypothetical protein|nr:hypothetical protein [Lachnospiraceae bacterium]
MKKIVVSVQRQSRELMANPHNNISLSKRQTKSGHLSCKHSSNIQDLGNGYSKIVRKK